MTARRHRYNQRAAIGRMATMHQVTLCGATGPGTTDAVNGTRHHSYDTTASMPAPTPKSSIAADAPREASQDAAPHLGLGLVFVLLWATGFVAARGQAPHGEPLSFLAIRFACVVVLFALICLVLGIRLNVGWPTVRRNIVTGILMQGLYLGGIFWAVDQGMPGAVAALIASLSPLMTAILAGPMLGESIHARQWLGLVLGVCGVGLTVWPNLGSSGFTALPLLVAFISAATFSLGSIYQRLHASQTDIRAANTIQFLGGLIVVVIAALILEPLYLPTAWQWWATLAWAVLVLSLGAVSLLIFLLRTGAVSKASALLFLVPGVAAVMTWAIFGETLGPVQLIGFAVTMLAVALATGKRIPKPRGSAA
jgi:drug/metabolite transporter (DMT)-like permease